MHSLPTQAAALTCGALPPLGRLRGVALHTDTAPQQRARRCLGWRRPLRGRVPPLRLLVQLHPLEAVQRLHAGAALALAFGSGLVPAVPAVLHALLRVAVICILQLLVLVGQPLVCAPGCVMACCTGGSTMCDSMNEGTAWQKVPHAGCGGMCFCWHAYWV